MRRAVLLDLYNTLLPGGDVHRTEMLRGMAADLGVDPDGFRKIVFEAWPERMTGAFGDLTTETAALATRLGAHPSPAGLAAAVERRFSFARANLRPSPAAISAVTALRAAGWPVAIVSNCSFDSAAALRTTDLATAANALVLSCEMRLSKPDPAMYLAACAALDDADPQACVFVGDGADDELRGAAALGMRVIQTTEYRATDRTWSGEQIASIAALPDLLRKVSGPPG